MLSKKTKIKSGKETEMKKKSSKNIDDEIHPINDRELAEMLEEEMPGELDEEDDEDFLNKVEEFKKGHANDKMINVYNKIGKPKFTVVGKIDPKKLKDELRRVIVILDKYNIIVHSHGDYDDREKYRFITEEIFNEYIEADKKKHVNFVYEDYHPEMDDSEDDEIFDDELL